MFETGVVGQRREVAFLKRLAQKERIPHALLFFGPEGTGKAAAALEVARAFHCERGGEGVCGDCRGCGKTAALSHADLSVLFPFPRNPNEETVRETLLGVVEDPYGYPLPKENLTISIDQIRTLRKRFSYGAFEGKWRTLVILHADRMRPEGANALLKTLEEPPERSLMVLTAPSLDALLPTVVSRCQFLKFPPLFDQDVIPWLRDRMGLEEDRARFIAQACGGSLRRAQEMASTEVEDVLDRAYRFLEALIWEEGFKTYTALEKLAVDPQLFQVLGGVEVWLRDILIYHNGGEGRVSNRDRLKDLRRLAAAFDLERLHGTAKKIESLREMNTRNVNLHMGLVSLWRQVSHYSDPVWNRQDLRK